MSVEPKAVVSEAELREVLEELSAAVTEATRPFRHEIQEPPVNAFIRLNEAQKRAKYIIAQADTGGGNRG